MHRFAKAVLIPSLCLVSASALAADPAYFRIPDEDPYGGGPGFGGYHPHEHYFGHLSGGTLYEDLRQYIKVLQVASGGAGGSQTYCITQLYDNLPLFSRGPTSFFDISRWENFHSGQPWPVDSFFDIYYEVRLAGSGSPVTSLFPVNPSLPSTDPARFFDITYLDSFFDITYRCVSLYGVYEMHLHGELQPALRIQSLGVNHQPSGDSFFDVFFDVDRVGTFDPSKPVLKTTTTGESLGDIVGVESATWGAIKSLYR